MQLAHRIAFAVASLASGGPLLIAAPQPSPAADSANSWPDQGTCDKENHAVAVSDSPW